MIPAYNRAKPIAKAKCMKMPKKIARTKQIRVETKSSLTKLESYLTFFYLEFFKSIFILMTVPWISSTFTG